jgi:predicted esterase
MLRDAGLDVRWVEFNGGHTITNGVVSELAAFVREVLPA